MANLGLYSIHDLAERLTFGETCYLLLKGTLPTRSEVAQAKMNLRLASLEPRRLD